MSKMSKALEKLYWGYLGVAFGTVGFYSANIAYRQTHQGNPVNISPIEALFAGLFWPISLPVIAGREWALHKKKTAKHD